MVDAFGRHIFKIVPSGSIPWSNRMSVSRVFHGQTKQREAVYANKFSMAFFAKFARLLVCLHLVGKNAPRILILSNVAQAVRSILKRNINVCVCALG